MSVDFLKLSENEMSVEMSIESECLAIQTCKHFFITVYYQFKFRDNVGSERSSQCMEKKQFVCDLH